MVGWHHQFSGHEYEQALVKNREAWHAAVDHLGAFAFSPDEGTVAAELDGQVSRGVAERRRQEVMRVQNSIWRTKAKSFVGKVLPALVVAPGIARLESQAPDVDGVTFIAMSPKAAAPAVGDVVQLRIVTVKGYDFEGTPAT